MKPAMRSRFPLPFLAALIASALLAGGCGKKSGENKETESPPIYRAPSAVPEFSGARAYELLRAQVAFGPRAPGSSAHAQCLQYLAGILSEAAPSVKRQEFTLTGYDGEPLRLTNLIASFHPEMGRRILLCAHWDSRPRADQEKDPALKEKPIPGANDGASGAAVLLALAGILKNNPPPVGVDLLFLDGEDYGREGDEHLYCLGAKYFASNLDPGYKPLFGILLDLVGDRRARFAREGNSINFAPDIVDLVWGIARDRRLAAFVESTSGEILDDHYSLNTVGGIKTIDIIDADLVGNRDADPARRYWHTLGDTPDKCSPETLGQVGTLLTSLVYGMIPA